MSVPCRLYFLLARAAPTGVIFRRGPSDWVQLIRWNTADDTFEPGQWFHGRIYERRCDLSPDGSKLIYFAAKHHRIRTADPAYTYAWTAISRPPYFTALALWPKGDSWHGGGLFETNDQVWLNHRPEAAAPHPEHRPPAQIEVRANPEAVGEDEPVLFRRLQRDGWVLRQEWKGHHDEGAMTGFFRDAIARGLTQEETFEELLAAAPDQLTLGTGYVTELPDLFGKQNPSGSQVLTMEHGRTGYTPYWNFSVRGRSGRATLLPHAAWADWDQRGRLVYAAEGRLFAAEPDDASPLRPTELADFNDAKPETVIAPEWARRW